RHPRNRGLRERRVSKLQLQRRRAEIKSERRRLEELARVQKATETSLDEEALRILKESWSRIIVIIESMNNGKELNNNNVPVNRKVLSLFENGEYDSILYRVVKNRLWKWESAEAILQARKGE
ncbi:MAG TPA: hypothetical protein PKA91_19965, partial [Leptospiraceae bacterium]|nr:hypothetical protein [Leptospiraceae bacterium]